jgi:hypothetical protein
VFASDKATNLQIFWEMEETDDFLIHETMWPCDIPYDTWYYGIPVVGIRCTRGLAGLNLSLSVLMRLATCGPELCDLNAIAITKTP